MINSALINPRSIAVVGASNHMDKPGGRLVYNLKECGFKGQIYPVNPKENEICGLMAYNSICDLPEIDLAVLSVSALSCVESAEYLVKEKAAKAIIVIAAGFSETGPEGKALEERLKQLAEEKNICIIGPNCIGVLTQFYKSVFITPPPEIYTDGVDFVSASGALAVFIFDLAISHGMRFSSIFSVGNSASNGVEEILEYWDKSFEPGISSLVKLVYVEQIRKPAKFYKHIRSLRQKGCSIVVLKPGDSDAGARAAMSHTGAFAGDSKAYALLIEKAGAIRCYSREEMVYLSCVLLQKPLKGNNIAIVTQAGGPAVMLTDKIESVGLKVPELDSKSQGYFKSILVSGSSTHNPVDMLATANREQLAQVLGYCNGLDYIDGMVVIYGKTGMEDLFNTYGVLEDMTIKCSKPIYSVLPSVRIGQQEINHFISKGGIVYTDEVVLGDALGKIGNNTHIVTDNLIIAGNSKETNKKVLDEIEVLERLKNAGISLAKSVVVRDISELKKAKELKFPLVAKVIGILHKTEVGGVVLNIKNETDIENAFEKISSIQGSAGVFIQEMISGNELFIGGKKHTGIGYSVHAGLGGIFVELAGDVSSCLAPVSIDEARIMLRKLKAQKIFSGFRNLPPVDFEAFAQTIVKFSNIFSLYPDIDEIDLNPLIANGKNIVTVDARIITG